MKQIKILLSSVLTLLLITSNNASYASLNFEEIKFTYKPNTGNAGRFNPKRNRLGDDLTGYGYKNKNWTDLGSISGSGQSEDVPAEDYGYKNILKKGNVFKGNVRMLPNRNSGGGRFNPASKYSISDEPVIIPKPTKMHDSIHCVSNSVRRINGKNFSCQNNKWLGPLGGDGVFVRGTDEKSGVIIGDNHFIGENGKVGIFVQDVGPEGEAGFIGQADIIDGTSNTVSPKGVPLKFINGIWTEDLPYD